MATTASSIIRRAAEQLSDTASVRWTVDQLVRYLNDGQRELVTRRPDSSVRTVSTALSTGARQTLPSTAYLLIDVVGNTVGQRAVRKVDQSFMDSLSPLWQSVTASNTVIHFMYDLRDPQVFYVYPPAGTSASLDLKMSIWPTDIAEPSSGLTYTAVTGNITPLDTWANALLNWVLYRAFSVDAEYGGNAQMAAAYLQLFNQEASDQQQAIMQAAPVQ
jgi:hypothetical protein